MSYKLFLDDERFPPEDGELWIIVRNYAEFLRCITIYGLPSFISFDHDLGEGKDGYDCAKWLVEICMDCDVDIPDFYVHSQNPIGSGNINGYLNCLKRFRKENR
jgi:hypothetical protein